MAMSHTERQQELGRVMFELAECRSNVAALTARLKHYGSTFVAAGRSLREIDAYPHDVDISVIESLATKESVMAALAELRAERERFGDLQRQVKAFGVE